MNPEGADVRDLYQELILDHSRKPRNFRKIEGAGHQAEGYNPLCGDRLTVYLDVRDGVVKDVGFEGSGCAISKASASVMTQTIKGKTRGEVEALFERFRHLVMGDEAAGAGPAAEGLHDDSPRGAKTEQRLHSPSPKQSEGGRPRSGAEGAESLGKLAAFSGVKEFPVRVKCATLAWHTVKAALEGKGSAVSTED